MMLSQYPRVIGNARLVEMWTGPGGSSAMVGAVNARSVMLQAHNVKGQMETLIGLG